MIANVWDPRYAVLFTLGLTVVVLGVRGLRLRARLRRIESRLAQAESEWVQALDFVDDAMYVVDLNDKVVRGNRAFFDLIKRTPEEALGADVMVLFHGAREDEPCPVCRARLERRDAVFVKEVGDPGNRRGRPTEIVVKIIRDAQGRPIGVLHVNRDLSRERAVEQVKERLMVTLESIGEAVITTDMTGVVQYMNPVAQRLTGWSNENAQDQPLSEVFYLFDATTGDRQSPPIAASLPPGQAAGLREASLRRRDQREFAIQYSTAPLRERDGRVVGFVLAFRDVTEMRSLAQQLAYQASHDVLTGLLNRREFERRVAQALDSVRSDDGDGAHALCYLDLDQFKVVNDTCGHSAGDELLRQLGVVLRTQLRSGDVLARLGGDEFGALLMSCPLQNARTIAEGLRRAARDFRFVWQDKTFDVGVSLGVVPITRATASVAEAMSAADAACYVAKDLGRNRVHVYQTDDAALAKHHGEMEWVARIARAIEHGALRLYGQPIQPLSADPNAPRMIEILVRMVDERNGELVPPMAFIPAAERYGVMPAVDRWVVREALGLLARCSDPCVFSINLSGRSLGDDQFLDFVREQLLRSPVASRVCFEITETAAITNFARAHAFVAALKRQGCRFALDDFGSGLSSFAYLKSLPVDFLKVDGRFVRDMVQDPIDCAMVESINQLGHVMGIRTIAEYVESEAVLVRLGELGVDFAQGYAIGVPRPIEEVLDAASLFVRRA